VALAERTLGPLRRSATADTSQSLGMFHASMVFGSQPLVVPITASDFVTAYRPDVSGFTLIRCATSDLFE